ncbi:MAG: GNAT family N-acetyltransferase [Alphaproteobacteria bacterium]|nr:GNAT family N-acetyltransferase [Alphaproteobacteria bacterium]
MSIDIKPLSRKTLEEALNVAVEIFGKSDKKAIEREFKASLGIEPDQTEVGNDLGINESKYFLPREKNGDPVGITGYYNFKGHEEEAWLGWFGVRSEHYGKGLGKSLMNEAFNRAATKGVKTLRIWTTSEPQYAEACKLYLKMGFQQEVYKPNALDAGKMVLIFSKAVDPNATHEISWAKTGYDIDAEHQEIPYLNRKYGLKAMTRELGRPVNENFNMAEPDTADEALPVFAAARRRQYRAAAPR